MRALFTAGYLSLFLCFFFFIGIALTDCFGLMAGAVGLAVFTGTIIALIIYIKTDAFSKPLGVDSEQ